MLYGKEIKKQWLFDNDLVFLNNGSFGASPIQVLEAYRRYNEMLERQPVEFFVDFYPGKIRETAAKLAELINCDAEGIVFVDNATTGVNTIMNYLSTTLKQGDEILCTNHDYPGVRNTLRYYCQRFGFQLKEVEIPLPISSSYEVTKQIKEQLSTHTKAIIIDHITSSTALIFPVDEIVRICRERGILTAIDGAHATGMIDLNISQINPDFYTGNCHKWLFAPKSCALLWVAPQYRQNFHPLVISLDYEQGYTKEFDWVGTKNPSPYLAINESIDFFYSLGGIELQKRNHSLVLEARTLIAEKHNLEIPCPDEMLGSMASLPLPNNHEVSREEIMRLRNYFLTNHKIEMPFFPFSGKLWFRISVQAYNDMDDYRLLTSSLRF
ncbi:MAG: Aminotran 5 protein [Ignavibacteria bacterium]|nr:Aminotran 5 protein [Ignavibacteria bacterium]